MKYPIKILCFPFAGGNKYSFSSFTQHLPDSFTMNTYEPPGRGLRIREPLITDMRLLVEDAMRWIEPFLTSSFVIYGHSMGSLLGYLVAKELQRTKRKMPLHLFVTGSVGPSSRSREEIYHDLPKKEFMDKLKSLGGCPPDILEDESVMDFFEPIIRADFQVIDHYRYLPSNPFDIPITCVIGDQEDITREEGESWACETTERFILRVVPGDHFFIKHFHHELVSLLVSVIKSPDKFKSYTYE